MPTQVVVPVQTYNKSIAPTPGYPVPSGTTRVEAVITFPGTTPDTSVVDVLVEASDDNRTWRPVATDRTEGGVGRSTLTIDFPGAYLRASATISGRPTFGVAITVS